LFALAGVFLLPAAWAEIPLYYNDTPLFYSIPGNPPPQIDAKAFFNDAGGVFTVDYATYNPGIPFYETVDTLFYTNTGTLIANGPNLTNGLSLLTFGAQVFACGYKFDLQTATQNLWSDTFYNPGVIHCVSVLDGNNVFDFLTIFGSQLFSLNTYGECVVNATNIVNPGTIEVSEDGFIGLTGNFVDVTQGQLIEEPPLFFSGLFGTVPISSTGAVGINTNIVWDPGTSLTATTAESSYVPIPPYNDPYMLLTNSLCYVHTDVNNGTNVYRYVFIENNSLNAPASVFFDEINVGSLGFQPGAAHVQWAGSYTDPATGNPVTTYLYLTDDYLEGTLTNDLIINGVPENFSFLTSPTPLLFNPTPPGPPDFLPNIGITNNYAVFDGELTASTANTNVSYANPHGTITNLPAQVYLTAAKELNLAYATITGENYVNFNCTNQFDGSPGAFISTPFADLALGVTNGYLTISNVLVANIPNWSGPIQAFSTVFESADTNGTNEYRIMIVFSALTPTTAPWIQNCYLHGTNSLTVSDHLNVYGSFYSDAKTLTLITNQLGAGATSLDGELFWNNPAPFNANSGSGTQMMPNLLWLTNFGALYAANVADFGSAATPQFAVIPAMPIIPAVPAVGTLSEIGTNAVFGDRVTIGTNQYTFVGTLTNKVANQIKRAVTFDGSLSNLIAAINAAAGSGTAYSTATKSNPKVTAGSLVNHAFTVTARTAGAAGDTIVTLFTPKTASVNLTWGMPTLANGANGVTTTTNTTAFVNHSLVSDQGTAIWTAYFESDGAISNGTGSFILQADQAVLTNGNVVASGDVILVATNTRGLGFSELQLSNQMIQAGHQLTLRSTNITGDTVTNGNIFVVGANSGGGALDSGFNVPLIPPAGAGNLLGTTVTNISPYNKTVYNVWAGRDYGVSAKGYSNNLALGHLVLDSLTTNMPTPPLAFVFNGATAGNALYVDLLELKDGATAGNLTNDFNFPWLKINTNMVIYYARAVEDINGQSYDDSEIIDFASTVQGANGGRLRWVSSYAGYYSSTNTFYTNSLGVIFTNAVNTALAQSTFIDSDSDGTPNFYDPTPFFVPAEMNFMVTMPSVPPNSVKIQWTTIPNATNYIYYSTNMLMPATNAFTNFTHWYYGNNVAVTNAAHRNCFVSPQVYMDNPSLPDNSQQTNVWIYDVITNVEHYYQAVVAPSLNQNETNAP
jgi:hypothetical protein